MQRVPPKSVLLSHAISHSMKAANTLLRTHGTSTKTHGVTAHSNGCALRSAALGTPRPDHEDGTLGSVFKGARGRALNRECTHCDLSVSSRHYVAKSANDNSFLQNLSNGAHGMQAIVEK